MFVYVMCLYVCVVCECMCVYIRPGAKFPTTLWYRIFLKTQKQYLK